jgi:hypothetical protein
VNSFDKYWTDGSATTANNMFALCPGDWLNFSIFKLQRLVSWDNTRLRKPATSQTQTLCGIFDDPEDNANDKTYSPIFSLTVDRH